MSVFFIADLHLGHSNIFTKWKTSSRYQAFDSIEEHDETILQNWNSVVTKRDVVWVLGDVGFNTKGKEILPKLNGIKHLVMGNHDYYPIEFYTQHFNKVCGMVTYKKRFLLTHAPAHPFSVSERYVANIHGHIHDVEYGFPYINVSAEHTDYTPRAWESILEEIKFRAHL